MSAAPTGTVAVRAAVLTDADAIRAVEGLGASTIRLLTRDLQDPDHVVLVARLGDQVVGVALGMLLLDQLHVTDLAVVPAWRRHGLGGRMLAELVAAGAARGATAATLEVRPSNVPALRLYRSAGFVEEGRRPDYYPPASDGTGHEDAIIMWRHDLGAS